jgi:tRNA(Ile2) C34 agmatinyltransferase TiaS
MKCPDCGHRMKPTNHGWRCWCGEVVTAPSNDLEAPHREDSTNG